MFTELEDYERGAHHVETAMRRHPEDPDILCNYSAVLVHRGQLEEALALCDRLLVSHPELHEARLNRALGALKRGQFAEGWTDYEARKSAYGNYVPQDFGFPEWKGEPLAGKSILVYAEQGLGDQLMFASCLPELLQQAGHCIVECSPPLEKLFRRSFPTAIVHAGNGTSREPDLLAKLLGTMVFRRRSGVCPVNFALKLRVFLCIPVIYMPIRRELPTGGNGSQRSAADPR